ncbi:unnamed protein product [Lepeophtheirus salmonis]|uniref:(salmon louse) hypothetical protein n=1 Tax=Lepeophtheirus salmonis TaxID=72036 RepID=A0A7R8HA11_LEPSM|nr:unnamed protein product [Lepeophtheirus salmonis]CAF2969416.1 unnamed protein product [Lepeophtheirus salmonis]
MNLLRFNNVLLSFIKLVRLYSQKNARNKWVGHESISALGDANQIDPEQSEKVNNSQSSLLSSSKGTESKTAAAIFGASSPPPAPLPRDELGASKRQQMPRTSSTTAGLGSSIPISTGMDSKFFSSSSYKMMDMFKTIGKKDERPSSSLSAHERLFGSSRDNSMSPPISPQILGSKVGSSSGGDSLSSSFSANSPIFKSAAAKAIIQEVGGSAASHRRFKKRDKKRSYTITGDSSSSAVIEALNDHAARACDDLDMERVLRGSSRPNAPDVVKSTLDKKDAKINPSSIDNLFGVPDKIIIPERYIPEADIDNLSREERQVRLKKADSIRRMLTENASTTDEHQNKEEKKQRERLFSLNQVLAREVMEKSRLVAGQSRMKHEHSN